MKNRWCFNKIGNVGRSCTKMNFFFFFFFTCFPPLQARDSPRLVEFSQQRRHAKEKTKPDEAKIERQRAERGITEKALERDGERWEEGGLCTSLLLLALLFLNGLVLLVGRLITRAPRLK